MDINALKKEIAELQKIVTEGMPKVGFSEREPTDGGIIFIEFTLGTYFVSLECRASSKNPRLAEYGLIANREILYGEGADEVYDSTYVVADRVVELLKNKEQTLAWGTKVRQLVRERAKVAKRIFVDKDYISRMTNVPVVWAEKHLEALSKEGKLEPILRLRDPDGHILEGEYKDKNDFPEKVPNRFYSYYYNSEECDVVHGYNIVSEKW